LFKIILHTLTSKESRRSRDDNNPKHEDDADKDPVDTTFVLDDEDREDHGEDRRGEADGSKVPELQSHHGFVVAKNQNTGNDSL